MRTQQDSKSAALIAGRINEVQPTTGARARVADTARERILAALRAGELSPRQAGARARAVRLWEDGLLSLGEAGRVLGFSLSGSYRERCRETRAATRREAILAHAEAVRERQGRESGRLVGGDPIDTPAAVTPVSCWGTPRRPSDRVSALLYRAAERLSGRAARKFVRANCKREAVGSLEQDSAGAWRLRQPAAEAADNGGGDDVAAGAECLEEVWSIYRAAFLSAVPLALRLWSMGSDSAIARRGRLAGLLTAVRASAKRQAMAARYVSRGRDGREVSGDWRGWGSMPAPESSDPRDVARGRGRREWVCEVPEAEAREAIAAAHAEAMRRFARASLMGKGAGPARRGAHALAATVEAIAAAMDGDGLPPEFAAEFSAGSEGGQSGRMRERLRTFRKAFVS